MVFKYFIGKGIDFKLVIDVGFVVVFDDGCVFYDWFCSWIIFFICDVCGCCIFFGGRVFDFNVCVKYLNGLEIVIFDKGWSFYNYKDVCVVVGKG